MTAPHVTEVRQAPGWWPALVRAVCSCGWHGPVRDMNDWRGRNLLRIDEREHLNPNDGADADDDQEDDQ